MKLWLIRHGETYGNTLARYVGGRTDEPLTENGRAALKYIQKKVFSDVMIHRLYSSPMKRCLETSALLFPGIVPNVIEDLRECDFGQFENKNYKELAGNPLYQAWVDSNATLPFPDGESREEFAGRSMRGLNEVITDIYNICDRSQQEDHSFTAVIVTHGGTIMNLMSVYSEESRDYYDWHVKNGNGYFVEVDLQKWMAGEKCIRCIRSAHSESYTYQL